MKRLRLILLIACFPNSASAYFQSGNTLHQMCMEKDAPTFARIQIKYYVAGLADYVSAQRRDARLFCVPNMATTDQAVDIVCRYLADNPAERHLEGGDLATAALLTAWPCK